MEWTLSKGVQVAAWASGNNRVGSKTYLWAIVDLNDDYVTPEIIEYQIAQPNETFTMWQPLAANQLEDNGDPNFGITFVPKSKGCYRVTIKVKLRGEVERILEGLYFEVV
jgi:hypothetical protein